MTTFKRIVVVAYHVIAVIGLLLCMTVMVVGCMDSLHFIFGGN